MIENQDDWIDVPDRAPAGDDDLNTGSVQDDQEWIDVPSPQQAATPAQASGADEWVDAPAPGGQQPPTGEEPTPEGSFIRAAAKSVVPGAGAAVAGLRGAIIGGEAGAMAAPFLGPAAPAGPIVGGLIGGLAGAIGGGWLTEIGQDKLLALMGFDKAVNEQAKLDASTNPMSSFAGGLAGSILPGFGAGAVPKAARAIGAAIQGGGEAAGEAYQGEPLDWRKIGGAAAAGAVFARPRGWLDRTLPARYRGGNVASPEEPSNPQPNEGGNNRNPDLKPDPEPTPDFGELESANKQPLVSRGTATEQPPAPEVPSAGNPEAAPMVQREAARPNDPTRDYRKDTLKPTGDLAANSESVVIKQNPVAPDTAAAMSQERTAPVQRPQATAEVPAPREAAPTREPPRPEPVEEYAPRGESDFGDAAIRAAERRGEVPDVARSPEEAAPKVPEQAAIKTGLTPAEIRVATKARQELAKLGYTKVLDAIDNAKLTPRQMAERLVKAYNMSRSATGEAKGRETGELRAETPRQKVSTGVTASSKADAARKEAALKNYKDVFDELGPMTERGKAIDPTDPKRIPETRKYVRDVWEQAMKKFGGDPFARGSGHYVPAQRGDEVNQYIQWLKAVRSAAKGRSGYKQFAALHKAPEIATEDRALGRTEADIARGRQVEGPAAEAQAVKAAEGSTELEPRHVFEPWRDPEQLESKVYGDQQTELRNWLNDLEDVDYRLLNREHPELTTDVNATQDPKELLMNLQDDLERLQKVRPPKGEITSEVELPSKKLDIPQMKSEPKNEGRVIDKNSEEGKALFAQYNDLLKNEKPTNRGTELEQRLAAQQEGRENELQKGGARETLDGSWEGYVKKAQDMLTDESGAGHLMPLNWMRKQPKNVFSPDADAATKEVVTSLGDRMSEFSKAAQTVRSAVRAIVQMTPKFDKATDAFKAHQEAYRWLEDHPTAADDVKIKDNKVFDIVHLSRRLQEEKQKVYALIRFYDPTNEFMLPPKESMTAIERAHVARLRDLQATADAADIDPFRTTNRSLSSWRGSMQNRDFKTLTDGKGMRVVFTMDDSGGVKLWWNGKPTERSAPTDFKGDVGEKLTINVNKNPVKMTVDNATTREVVKHARDDEGKVLKFHENPILTEANALVQAQDALDTFKLLREIENDKGFNDNTMIVKNADDLKKARDKGYNQTKLDSFKERNGYQLYMDRRLSEALDDYRQAGLDEDSLQTLRNAGVRLIKTLFVINPAIHGLNVGASWGVQRGWDWVTPKGNYWLAKTTFDAIKAVMTQDPKVIKPAMENGLTLLLPGTLNSRMMQKIALRAGHELKAHPPKWWDAMVYPEWKVRASDVGSYMMEYANRITWGMSDVMTIQRYLENIERRSMWPKDAAKETHEWLPDYRVPTRVNEKMLGEGASRLVSKIAREPGLSIFGAYHYDLFKQLAKMTKGVVHGDPKAAGQMMALAVGMYIVYPWLLDKAAEKITGNKYASVGRRGPFAPAHAIAEAVGINQMVNSLTTMLTGKKVNPLINKPSISTDIYMPTIPLKVGSELLENKDFAGHKIFPSSVGEAWRMGPGRAAAHVADWALSTALPPYQIMASEYKKTGAHGGLLARLLEEQVGIKNPTPAAIKYALTPNKPLKREMKYRAKHPGPLEGAVQGLTNR